MSRRTAKILRKVVFYGLIFVVIALIIALCSANARIDELTEQRDIYKARFENWSQRAIDDEEKLDRLQSKPDVSAMAAVVKEAVIASSAEYVETAKEAKETVEATPTPVVTKKPEVKAESESKAASSTSEKTVATENLDEENSIGVDTSGWTYAGEFLCTAYCCEKYEHICGTGTGITASGAPVQAGVTVAADTSRFSFGTVLYIEGVGYRTVQDKGSAVKGNHLDVAVDTHANALKWSGYGKHRVWVVK